MRNIFLRLLAVFGLMATALTGAAIYTAAPAGAAFQQCVGPGFSGGWYNVNATTAVNCTVDYANGIHYVMDVHKNCGDFISNNGVNDHCSAQGVVDNWYAGGWTITPSGSGGLAVINLQGNPNNQAMWGLPFVNGSQLYNTSASGAIVNQQHNTSVACAQTQNQGGVNNGGFTQYRPRGINNASGINPTTGTWFSQRSQCGGGGYQMSSTVYSGVAP